MITRRVDGLENSLGKKIKDLRTGMGWSLKDLGNKVNLSPAYLSLVERGLTSVNVTTLQSIAEAFSVSAGEFLQESQRPMRSVTRSYEREVRFVDDVGYVCLSLAGNINEGEGILDPVVALIPPERNRDHVQMISHEGEEFGIVLEGVITVILGDKEYDLNSGDSYHILSKTPHYVGNLTNKISQLLLVTTPKTLVSSEQNVTKLRRGVYE